MESKVNQEKRLIGRYKKSISAILKIPKDNSVVLSEATELTTVSKNGASFYLEQECHTGRLISMVMQLPTELRCYDLDQEFYLIWGIVQHCTTVSNEQFSGFYIGVAFIGKNAPNEFKINPLASYRISGLNENGLWEVKEAEREFVVRKYPRFDFKLGVKLSLLDTAGKIITEVNTYTINISRKGAAVFSNFDFTKADKIIFTCTKYFFQSSATICNQPGINKETSILHLEFVEKEFPIRELFPPVKLKTDFEIISGDLII